MYALILLILSLVLLVVFHVVETRQQQHILSPVCAAAVPEALLSRQDTILVVFPVYRHRDAALCIDRIFDTAAIPGRVYVAVVEHNEQTGSSSSSSSSSSSRSSAWSPTADEYSRLVHLGARNQLSNVRAYCGHVREVFGGSVARQEVLQRFYNGENYLYFVHSHSWFLPDWDTILVESLRKVHRLGGHLVSCFPLRVAERTNIPYAQQSLPSTFPVFDKFVGGLPSFQGRFFPTSTTLPTRVGVASYQCLFGTADVLFRQVRVHDPGVPCLRSIEADFILSTELWAQGYEVYCPTRSPLVHMDAAFHSHEERHSEDLEYIRKAVLRYFSTGQEPGTDAEPLQFLEKFKAHNISPLDFHKWLGVDLEQQYIAGRLSLGLLQDHTEADIVRKYGSVFNFERLKSRICI